MWIIDISLRIVRAHVATSTSKLYNFSAFVLEIMVKTIQNHAVMRSWQQALVLSKESRSGDLFFSSFSMISMFMLPSLDSPAPRSILSSPYWFLPVRNTSPFFGIFCFQDSSIETSFRNMSETRFGYKNYKTYSAFDRKVSWILTNTVISSQQLIFSLEIRGILLSCSKTWRMLPWPYKGLRHICYQSASHHSESDLYRCSFKGIQAVSKSEQLRW